MTRHPVLYYYWFEFVLPRKLKELNIDLFLSPDGYLSLSTSIKSLAVIHDLNFEHFPEYLPLTYRFYYRHFFPKFAKKAKRIATVSQFSKDDIVSCYNVDKEKIDVVYNGAHNMYKPLNAKEITKVRNQYANGDPFFVFVGTMHPRKNIDNLLLAFDQFKKKTKSNVKIVLIGDKKWWSAEIKAAYEGMEHSDDVVFTGRLDMLELCRVVASALALTYVSHFEGFGIPLIEAMNCDVPIITSDVTSMPEIAGDSAIYATSTSIDSIEDAMTLMYKDEDLRKKLIENGRKKRQKFSWDITAKNLWASIEKVLET